MPANPFGGIVHDSPAVAFSGRTSFNPSVVDRTAEAGMM
jgi:hypothetical protein